MIHEVQKGTNLAVVLQKLGVRKRKYSIRLTEASVVETHPGWWDGGSRDEDHVVSRDPKGSKGFAVQRAPQASNPFNFNGTYPTVEITDFACLLTAGTFCGKDATPVLRVTRYLPSGLRPTHSRYVHKALDLSIAIC